MRVTWKQLLTCPEIADRAADARSVAEHERWEWYPVWIGGSEIFRLACQQAAAWLGVAPEDVRPVALTGLLASYHDAKRRLRPAAPSYGKNRRRPATG